MRIVVGFGPGGGYDLYAREVGRFLGRHLPGNPTVVVQNMVGAGSLKSVNFLYNAAPRDGTMLASFARGIVFEPLIGHPDGAQFDAPKLNWIGSVSNEVGVCATYLLAITVANLALPTVNEVPEQFPADLLWHFRVASVGGQLIMWTSLGLAFGPLAERAVRKGAQPGYMMSAS